MKTLIKQIEELPSSELEKLADLLVRHSAIWSALRKADYEHRQAENEARSQLLSALHDR